MIAIALSAFGLLRRLPSRWPPATSARRRACPRRPPASDSSASASPSSVKIAACSARESGTMGESSLSPRAWISAISAARSATVGVSKMARNGISTWKASVTRDSARMPSRECPPRSKKLSYTPTRSTPSSSAQMSATSASTGVRGATYVRARSDSAPVGRRERVAVELPRRRQRQRRQGDERRRDHVLGKRPPQEPPRGDGEAVVLGGVRVANDVRDEPRLTRRVLAQHDGGRLHARELLERRFDLAELDAESAQLHLLVDAAEELDVAVWAVAGEVAGLVRAARRRRPRTGWGRTSPPSARDPAGTRARGRRRRCEARRGCRAGRARGGRRGRRPARSRSAVRSARGHCAAPRVAGRTTSRPTPPTSRRGCRARRPGRRPRKARRARSSAVRRSTTQKRSAGSRRPRSGHVSSSARRRDGTSQIRVTWFAASASTNAFGSRTCSAGTITLGTPLSNGPRSSHTESTKPRAVFWHATSPSAKGYASHIQWSRLRIWRCSTATPFGRPVEPEV